MTYIIDMIKQSAKRRHFLVGETYYKLKLYMYYIKNIPSELILLTYIAICFVAAFLAAKWRI
jgi:hypothetical protein